MSRRLLQLYFETLNLFEPPIVLPPVEITAYWHFRSHDEPGHQWLRSQLIAAAAAIGRR